MAYGIQFPDDGLKDAKALPKNIKNALAQELKTTLASDPKGRSEALREPVAGWRSFHSGSYRVIFKVYDDLRIIAIGIGKHSSQAGRDIYRRVGRLGKNWPAGRENSSCSAWVFAAGGVTPVAKNLRDKLKILHG